MVNSSLDKSFENALSFHRAGRLKEAEQGYREILAIDSAHPGALHCLGVIRHRSGDDASAVDLLQRAVNVRADYAPSHSYLGSALLSLGRREEAEAALRQAIALKPDVAGVWNNLGNVLAAGKRLPEAIEAYEKAIGLDRNFPAAWNNLGNGLKESGDLRKAIDAFRKAVALKVDFPEAWINLGSALRLSGEPAQAADACRRAASLKPDYFQAYNNLGNALTELGKVDEASAAYRRAIELNPASAEAHNNLASALKNQGLIEEAIAEFQRAVDLNPDYRAAHSNLVYTIHFVRGYDAERHRQWNRQHAMALRPAVDDHANLRDPDRRLRIGYVSPDFKQHPVGRFMAPLLSHHDRSRCEIFAYSDVVAPDVLTLRLRGCADHWREITGVSDQRVADLIREDRIDILIDLTMHMAGNRMLVFARKPAPVQVTYLAYCSSTGLEAMDYRLSDPWMEPPGIADPGYTERTIRLAESYWCYAPIVDNLEIKLPPVVRNGYVTFGSFNNFCKITEPVVSTWTRILYLTPNSRLLIHAHEGNHRNRMRERFGRDGIEPDRIEFISMRPTREYFEMYASVDIALDTFPYCGGTTTCDALWMGVPVVTLAGDSGIGRGGVSILTNLGLPEFIADSPAKYVQIACELARDQSRLGQLRSTLRQQMQQSPLMDAPRFAATVQAAYARMWREWCENPQCKEGR